MRVLILYLCLSLCYGQAPLRIRSISNPNRFDFSLLTVDTSNASVLVGGSDYIIRVGSDFRQDTITNVANLQSRVSLLEYDHFDNRFFVCNIDRVCHFYDTSDITTSLTNLSSIVSNVIPNAALFTSVDNSPSVYLYSSFVTSSITSTRLVVVVVAVIVIVIVFVYLGIPYKLSVSPLSPLTPLRPFSPGSQLVYPVGHS